MFSNRRGSPNTITEKEACDENMRMSSIAEVERQAGSKLSKERVLSFKAKKNRCSMNLQKNISLINTIAQEKTQLQQKSLRCIPQFPEKILDAPDLVDDYYLNLLDWGQENNVLAVCLAQTVYLWNAVTGDI